MIGINTAVSYEGESIAFAIPINAAKRAINDVQTYGRIVRPWLGVRYVLVIPEEVGDSNLEYEIGAMVVDGDQPGEYAVFPGSPADASGIVEGDVIVSVNGIALTVEDALAKTLSIYHPEDIITLDILRGGVLESIEVTLAEYGQEI